jgi:hypothetical protein
MGVWSRYEDVDVERQPYRRCGPPVVIYDHGPQMPEAPNAAAKRRYLGERDEYLRASGGKPYRVVLNAVDAFEWCRRDRRFSFSATALEPMQAQPRTTGQVINLVAATGAQLGGFWLLDLISGNKYVVFSPDYVEWQSRDLRYQPTTPSA